MAKPAKAAVRKKAVAAGKAVKATATKVVKTVTGKAKPKAPAKKPAAKKK
jgi:hypothetical protein